MPNSYLEALRAWHQVLMDYVGVHYECPFLCQLAATSRSRIYKEVWGILALLTASGDLEDDGLNMCHKNPSNCFWLLILPKEFWGAFRILVGERGGGYSHQS